MPPPCAAMLETKIILPHLCERMYLTNPFVRMKAARKLTLIVLSNSSTVTSLVVRLSPEDFPQDICDTLCAASVGHENIHTSMLLQHVFYQLVTLGRFREIGAMDCQLQ